MRHLEGEERSDFLVKYAEQEREKRLADGKRSLVLCAPLPTAASFALDEYSGKYDARVYVPGVNDGHGIPVTDLKWRALGRKLIQETGNSVQLSASKLKNTVGFDEVYLAFGLSRTHDGKNWLLAVGVHTVPDYKVTVDYNHP